MQCESEKQICLLTDARCISQDFKFLFEFKEGDAVHMIGLVKHCVLWAPSVESDAKHTQRMFIIALIKGSNQ